MSRSVRCLVLSLVLLILVRGGASKPSSGPLRAGTGITNITPWLGAWTYAGHERQGVHDELQVRALALDNGSFRLVLAVVDSALIPRSLLDAAKLRVERRTGLPADRILIAATHTHSAPVAAPVLDSAVDGEYSEFLVRRMADAVELALNNLQPALIGWGSGRIPDQVFNRRSHMKPGTIPPNPFGGADRVQTNPSPGSPDIVRPAGPTDPTLSVIGVRRPGGEPVALFANYSLHYVGGTDGQISADYFGYFAERMAELLGAGDSFAAMLSNGASGDVNNIDFTRRSPRLPPFEKIRQVADQVAAEAARIYRGMEFHDRVPLGALQGELDLGVRRPSREEVLRARRVIMDAQAVAWPDRPRVYARETLLLDDFPAAVRVPVQVIRIGEAAMAALPAEPFAQIGLDIREGSPFAATFTVSYANGYNGYLPTPEQHRLGGYETWRARSSYLEPAASEKLTARLVEMLHQLSGPAR